MDPLTREHLRTLVAVDRGPCVSLYLPLHPGGGEGEPVRWKNLLRQAEEGLLARGVRAPQVKELLRPALALLEDRPFWQGPGGGLAFFVAPELVRVFRVPAPLAEAVVVGPHLHVKPLIPLLADNGRFYVLAVSQNGVHLLLGTRHSVHEVDVRGIPHSLAEALRFDDKQEPLLFHTRPAPGRKGAWATIFHGQGVGIDDEKDDLLRYFQEIDRGLHELLRDERAPLVLASVEYLWPIYRQASKYPHVLGQGVAGSPDRLSARELHDRAWALVEPHFQEAQRRSAARYAQLAGTGRASGDLELVVRAADRGGIETLFVALDAEQWGKFDAAAGAVTVHERPEPGDEDLLNLAAVRTLLHKGAVYAVGREEVPGRTAAAAVFWFPLAKHGK